MSRKQNSSSLPKPIADSLVWIRWEDSCSKRGWQDADHQGAAIIHSVGVLVREDKECVVLSTSIGADGHFLDQLTIPRGAILIKRDLL